MTPKDDPAIKEALDSAANAIRRGDLETGKAGLRWVHKRDPDNVLVWLWMSRCTENAEEKLECFNRVLALDPTNKHALAGIQRFSGEGKSQESLASFLKRSRATLMEKQNARAILILVVIAFIALVLVMGPEARVSSGGSGSSSTSPSRSPVIANTCPTGFLRMEEDAKLYKNVDSDSDDYGAYYHVIPAGNPVGATGRCSRYYAEVMHQGDTGWVSKDKID